MHSIPLSRLGIRLLGLTLLMGANVAHPQSVGSQDGSQKVSLGTASILVSPAASASGSADGEMSLGALLAATGASFVVTGVAQLSADTTELILESASGAAKVSVRVGASVVRGLGVSTGAAVQAVAASTGTVLVTSGKVLAFIPNTVGESLLHHERVPG
ncbi:hypothetical protein [Achromobacter xylosoxidans]|uniref:hypothetical protein n=1 Tax=Alcaligenes xylosoxydans xylosoxydans TaxID=85698 RepID=UPI001F133247|nr:hypothetical protein [Achromobacter xylosoxidans]